MKCLYMQYFDMEVSNAKGLIKKSETELQEKAFASCLQFCKEFDFMPYMLSQRVIAFIWYTVVHTGAEDSTMSKKGINQELCNNPDQTRVIPASQNIGRTFTFAHFIIFFYRVAILSFDLSIGITGKKFREFNLIKKLLRILN